LEDASPAPSARRHRAALWAGPLAGLLLGAWAMAGGHPQAFAIVVGLTVWVALWWILEPVPAPVTGLLPLALLPAFGVLDARRIAEAYGNELILLLAGGFMLAQALEHNGAHRRLAQWMLMLTGAASGRRLLAGFILASGLTSMWISNTATTLMLIPVALAILERYPDRRLDVPLILGIAYAASLGGLGTPIGTTPNLVFMQVYQQTEGRAFSFAEWMSYGLPIVALSLPLLWLWIGRNLAGAPAARLPALPPMRPAERRVLLVFLLVALAWVFRSGPAGGWSGWLGVSGINDASIAMLGVVALFLVPNGEGGRLLNWERAERIPWGVLLVFAGGIALASGFQSSGLSDWLASHFSGLTALPLLLLVFGLALGVTLMSEIASNTATAVLLMPVLAAAATAAGVDPLLLMMPAAMAASLGFMLPVATAPNMVAFGTGRVSTARMIREGWAVDVIGVAAVTLVVWLLLP
jgi:sodium-dependent dicarboxylate transporter 2/3/5